MTEKEYLLKYGSWNTGAFVYKKSSDANNKFDHNFSYVKAYKEGTSVFWAELKDVEVIKTIEYEYYISIEQDGYKMPSFFEPGHETKWYVNFRIEEDEFIPLTYLCSTWIKDVIRTGHIGKYRICGVNMTYAAMIPYLNIIKEHLEEREKREKALIDTHSPGWTEAHDGWDAVLCEWKIKNQVHSLTSARAKRFLREQRVNRSATSKDKRS